MQLATSINLDTSESSSDDVSRFVPQFQSVWEKLPEFVTRVISAHWKQRVESFSIRLYSFGKNSAGNTRSNGHDLRFNSDLFRIMPEELGTTAIAHELGHVMFLALSEECHRRAEEYPNVFVNVWSVELINLQMTRQWGYSQDKFSEWLNCAVSTSGPYLRETAGEPPVDFSEYQERIAKLTTRWGEEQGIDGKELIDDACRRLIRSKEPYYRMATTDSERYEQFFTPTLDDLATILRQESDATSE